MRDIGLRIFFSKLQLWHWANKETVAHHKTLLKFIWFVFLKSSYIHSIYTEARDLTNVWGSIEKRGKVQIELPVETKIDRVFVKRRKKNQNLSRAEAAAVRNQLQQLKFASISSPARGSSRLMRMCLVTLTLPNFPNFLSHRHHIEILNIVNDACIE